MAITITLALAAWNNLLHLSPRRWRTAVVSTGVGAGAAGCALLSVWLWGTRASGFQTGMPAAFWWAWIGAGVAGIVVLAGHLSPRMGRLTIDRRISGMGRRAFLGHVGLRIPLVTGLAEEVLFRGAAWAALAAVGGPALALGGSSLAFGAWHLVVSAQQSQREGGRRGPVGRWMVLSVLATILAGLVLGGVRIATSGIWAPAALHASVNVVLALGARLHGRRLSGLPAVPRRSDLA